MQIGRIYVINLDRDTGRWHQMRRELNRVRDAQGARLSGISKRVGGVDARYEIAPIPGSVDPVYTLADQLYVDPYPLPISLQSRGDRSIEMSAEEVAIALSHVKVWELIAAGEHNYGLVLEDDVYFPCGFARVLDRAWAALASTVSPDLLYISYEEARSGAEWIPAPAPLRRPVRGLWQLSGYVVSKHGAKKLLDRLPVRGPVDLWVNYAFTDLNVFALRRPVIKQRRDLPSRNYYSALAVLSQVGVLTGEKAPAMEPPATGGPIFVTGERGTGVSAVGQALSLLGYRCCSDVDHLPMSEWQALLDPSRPRVFDAYVNVGTLTPSLLAQLATSHPEAKFIVTTGADDRAGDASDGAFLQDLTAACIGGDAPRCLVVPMQNPDKWHLLTEFLGCDYPSHRYPSCGDGPQRTFEYRTDVTATRSHRSRTPRWDALPWIVESEGWEGIPTRDSLRRSGVPISERFATPTGTVWTLRDDTFPSNLALFTRSNFESLGDGQGRLILRRERTSVRRYTSAALSTEGRYRYGRFVADLMPARVPGLVTGMFLHRNSPRQEIDIEFVGSDTTKLLINVYFNPGEDGTRMEYGYLGTPEVIDLGFDAAEAFHRYEIDWRAERIQWRVDGEVVRERVHWSPTPVPHLPMQFHINLWHTRSKALAGRLSRCRLPAHAHLRNVEFSSYLVDGVPA